MTHSRTNWRERLQRWGQIRFEWSGLPWLRPASSAQRESLMAVLRLAVSGNQPLIPLLESLAHDESYGQRRRIEQLVARLREGRALGDALETTPGLISPRDLQTVRMGLQMGNLRESLQSRELAFERLSPNQPRWLMWQAFWYLLIMLAFLAQIGLLIILKVVPTMQQILRDMSVETPPSMRRLMELAALATNWFWLLPLLLNFVVVAAWIITRRHWLHRVPALGWLTAERNQRTAELLEQLSLASSTGRPLSSSISALARYHHQPRTRRDLLYLRNELEQGATLWETLQQLHYLRPTDVAALRTAEAVGNRDETLQQLAQCRRAQARRWTQLVAEWTQLLIILAIAGIALIYILAVFGFLRAVIDSQVIVP